MWIHAILFYIISWIEYWWDYKLLKLRVQLKWSNAFSKNWIQPMLGVISLAIYHISNVGSCSNTATEFQPMSNERIGLNCLYVFMRWFASFFSNWSQLVCVNEYRSVPFFVTSKVPQCSQLGPSLFSIFIYNFTDCFKFSRILWWFENLKKDSDSTRLHWITEGCIGKILWLQKRKRILINVRVFLPLEKYPVSSFHIVWMVNQLNGLVKWTVIFDSKLSFSKHADYIVN